MDRFVNSFFILLSALLSVLGLSFWLAACGDPLPDDLSQPSIIIGEDNLQFYQDAP